MKAKLVLTSKDRQTVQEVPFDRPSITIGRKPNNDLAFNRPEISGSHAAFLFENNQYFVMDLGSTNGTLLNGAQLVAREKYGLQDQDVITVAPYTIQFSIEDESMETMIEVVAKPASSPKVMRSGTAPDLSGQKIGTGTEENMARPSLQDIAAAAPPKPAPPPPPASNPAPAAVPPEPVSPPPAAPAPAAPVAAAPAVAPARHAPQVVLPETGKTPSAFTDYLWLGIGAILVLAAIAFIFFILVSF